jgi:membrane associated rhomboid family serine protease
MARKRSNDSMVDAIQISCTIVFIIFGVFYLNLFMGGRLNLFGVRPRSLIGLTGILFSPLLHYNAQHLMANGTSLFVLLIILFSHRAYQPDATLTGIWLLSGLGTWIIGRPNHIHIGASGVIYGLVVYLIAAGWWLRDWRSLSIAALLLFFYGGIFYGMLPQPGFISWEGHLSGALAGFFIARHQHA